MGGEIVKLDLAGTHDGSNSKATVNMDRGNFELLIVGAMSYFKADESFFAENAGEDTGGLIATLVGDKWISTSAASASGDFSVGSMLESMAADDLGDFDSDKITGSSLEVLEGLQALKYTGEKNAFWIAAEGEPDLLQVEGSDADGGGSGNLTFVAGTPLSPSKLRPSPRSSASRASSAQTVSG